MELLTINGLPLPEPDEYRVETEPVGVFRRNANGRMVGDLLALKSKISAGWAALPDNAYRAISASCAPMFVRVRWLDPETGAYREDDMCASGVTGRMARRAGGVWWSRAALVLEQR